MEATFDAAGSDVARFHTVDDLSFTTAVETSLVQSTGAPDVREAGLAAALFADDVTIGADASALGTSLQAADYSDFQRWIEGYVRPENPCDYCRVRRLECYMNRTTKTCSSCSSLFRECSLSNSNTLEASNFASDPTGTFLDTLHPIDENTARERGSLTGIKPMASRGGRVGVKRSSSPSPVRAAVDDEPGSLKRNGIRFPKHAVKVLREWVDSHLDHPYPTEKEKAELERSTDLKPVQVANWLANARRRRKVTERAKHRACQSPSLRPTTLPIDIAPAAKPWDELNPLERWQHSPPQNEPASMKDIAHAVENSSLPDEEVFAPSPSSRRQHSSSGSRLSLLRAPSTVSQETTNASSFSAGSSAKQTRGSGSSHGSSFGSFSSSLAGKRDRRRRRRQAMGPTGHDAADVKKRVFQCTFCTDTFKSKYDWTRHEKSLHLSLEKWVCAPDGPVVGDHETGVKRCVYCGIEDPSKDHIESHNHSQCADKGLDGRTFYRKDHLRQHLRLIHQCELIPLMEAWKSVALHINSRCGFCAKRFTIWQERIDHLTAHFKAGARMTEWKGCRGLDPAVAAQVTNAMPPYLIGVEQLSPVPFSAADRTTWRDLEDMPPSGKTAGDRDSRGTLDGTGRKTTCWEQMTIKLSKFASESAAKGILITDEMLQREARIILYESDDPWNHTAADNQEWLDLFKKAHGLEMIPTDIGGVGQIVPEDLETYGDLGLRIPFSVQLEALNRATTASKEANAIGDASHPSEHERQVQLAALCNRLTAAGVLRNYGNPCHHDECDGNQLNLGGVIGTGDQVVKRWCMYEMQTDRARELLGSAPLRRPANAPYALPSVGEAANQSEKEFDVAQRLRNVFNIGESFPGGDHIIAAEATANAEPSQWYGQDPAKSGKKSYLQRHRLTLPADIAQRFATITGEWEDSGKMPPTESTASLQSGNLTTDAIMELLGGDLGSNIPFSTDILSPSILPTAAAPLQAQDEQNPEQLQFLMDNLERVIAETTGNSSSSSGAETSTRRSPSSNSVLDQHSQPLNSLPSAGGDGFGMVETTLAPAAPAGLHSLTMDFDMDDVSFDDITFDTQGIFDMTLDDQDP